MAAAPASAATITYSDAAHNAGVVIYAATAGETLDTNVGYKATCTVPAGTTTDCVSFSGDTAPTLGDALAQQVCGPDGGTTVCVLDAPNGGVQVVGGAGNDSVSVFDADIGGFPASTPYPITLDGGAGNDRLTGGSGGEAIHGGPGADRLAGAGGGDALDGGDGNDVLLGDGGFNGNDRTDGGGDKLSGGAGDDTLTGDSPNQNARIGADLLDGGPGVDTVSDDWYRFTGAADGSQDPAPSVTFDGQANDGRPGEGDDVVNVERIDTGYEPDSAAPATFSGDDGPNTFHILFAHASVSAAGGDDVVTGSDYADAIDGGPGNDQLSGGFGDDVITGGPGRDDIGGDRTAACFYGPIFGSCTFGSGNDTIYAQDGEADAVDCGPGLDVAYVDAVDQVAGCETVHAPGSAPVPPGGSPPPANGAQATVAPAPTLKVSALRWHSIRRAKSIRVSCTLAAPGRCTVRATISRKDARKLRLHVSKHARALTLASGSATLKHAGRGTVRLKLSRAKLRALRRAHTIKVTFRATATYADGSRTATKRIKVKR
jgi:hypothetical protein